ncbi:MAG: hypothetical protein ACLTNY_07910, partial [Blautia massiliensis (ex Durand et al. 2017)]
LQKLLTILVVVVGGVKMVEKWADRLDGAEKRGWIFKIRPCKGWWKKGKTCGFAQPLWKTHC